MRTKQKKGRDTEKIKHQQTSIKNLGLRLLERIINGYCQWLLIWNGPAAEQRRQDAQSKVIPILSDSFRLWKDFPELFSPSVKSFFKLLGSRKVVEGGRHIDIVYLFADENRHFNDASRWAQGSVQRPIKINTFIDRNGTLFSVIYWARSHLWLLSNSQIPMQTILVVFQWNCNGMFSVVIIGMQSFIPISPIISE